MMRSAASAQIRLTDMTRRSHGDGCGDRAGLRDSVHVEWLSSLVKHFDYLRTRNGVTDAHAGKAMSAEI